MGMLKSWCKRSWRPFPFVVSRNAYIRWLSGYLNRFGKQQPGPYKDDSHAVANRVYNDVIDQL